MDYSSLPTLPIHSSTAAAAAVAVCKSFYSRQRHITEGMNAKYNRIIITTAEKRKRKVEPRGMDGGRSLTTGPPPWTGDSTLYFYSTLPKFHRTHTHTRIE